MFSVSLYKTTRGRSHVSHFRAGHKQIQNESAILISLTYPLLLKIQVLGTNLFSLQLVLCRVAAVKRLPVHHHSEIIFSGPLGY